MSDDYLPIARAFEIFMEELSPAKRTAQADEAVRTIFFSGAIAYHVASTGGLRTYAETEMGVHIALDERKSHDQH